MGAGTKDVSKMVMTEVLPSAHQQTRSVINASNIFKVRTGPVVGVESRMTYWGTL